MFDDWVTNSNGVTGSQNMDMGNMNHTNHMNSSNSSTNENMNMGGMMEIIGDTDTINGKSYGDIKPVEISTGEVAKLRLINSSTGKISTINFPFLSNKP